MKRALVVPVIALFASSPAFAGPPRKIEHRLVTVEAANDEWTPTDLKLEKGDVLVILASGAAKIGPVLGLVGPDGVNGSRHEVGTLELKVGPATTIKVGSNMVIVGQVAGERTGTLKLRLYDTNYEDNGGRFQVRLVLVPAELIPAPTPVAAD